MTALYVATIDLGGISYSDREFVAVGTTAAKAKVALVKAITDDRPPEPLGVALTTVKEIDEWYGIHVHGPIEPNTGIRSDL